VIPNKGVNSDCFFRCRSKSNRLCRTLDENDNLMATNPYRSVLEDLDWLWNEWWLGEPDVLTSGHLRRGSSTLRLLLVDGLLQKAWKHYGFQRQPIIVAPDIAALAAEKGYRLDLAAGVIAGGGRQNGLEMALIGAFRVENPSTGMPADANEGFAVAVVSVVRQATDATTPSALDSIVNRAWSISEYLESPGAVRKGVIVKRREVIEYFRNYVGGAHHDLLKGTKQAKRQRYELVAELERHVRADIRDGLHFELLSIGQAVARSADIRELAERIRNDMSSV